MQARWDDADVREFCSRHAGLDPDVARRVHGARLLGAEPELGTAGMGSASLKLEPHAAPAQLLITPRATDLARLDPGKLCALELAALRELCREGGDAAPLGPALLRARIDPDAPAPPAEAVLHAAVPARSVDQTHPTALLALACQPDGELRVRAVLGARVGWVPWQACVRTAARAVADACAKHPELEALVVQGRGLLSFGAETRESTERALDIARRAEAAVLERMPAGRLLDARPVVAMREAGEVAPLLRGALALPTGGLDHPFVHLVLAFRASDEIAQFASAPLTPLLAAATPPTEAHARLAGGAWLFVPQPPYSDPGQLRQALRREVEANRRAWVARVERGAPDESGPAREIDPLDPTPRALLLPGLGLFGAGETRARAREAVLAAEHAIRVKVRAAILGQYEGLPEPAALLLGPARRAAAEHARLTGQIALVAGASECGRAAARALREASAEVIAVDSDPERLEALGADLHGIEKLEVDLADALDARDALHSVSERVGGLDILVLDADALGMAGGTALVEESLALLASQGTGGSIVLVARDVHVGELCRSAASRGAPDNVRANAVQLGPAQPGNALRIPVTSGHAARAAVFLAERSAPITGQMLRIDAGGSS